MFGWFKNLVEKQKESNKKIKETMNSHKEKALNDYITKTDKYINSMLTETGTKQSTARVGVLAWGKLCYPAGKVDYIGGHPNSPQGQEDVQVVLIPQGLLIGNSLELIPMDEIKTVSYKTKEQIEKDVTLTRLVAFGWYAFALKKKKKTVTNYLIVNCERNGVNYALAFAGNEVASLYSGIFNRLAS